jgi:hypothetical protein
VLFGVGPDHSDSVLQCVNDSHASFRAARNRLFENEQEMSERVSSAGIVTKCRVKDDGCRSVDGDARLALLCSRKRGDGFLTKLLFSPGLLVPPTDQ